MLFFVFYTTPGGCYINKFFISFNMLFCVVASVISVLPKVQVQFKLPVFASTTFYCEKCDNGFKAQLCCLSP